MKNIARIGQAGFFIFLWICGIPGAYGASEATSPAQAVVSIRANVPPTARTAQILGRERTGHGIVIDNQGLIVTIGYLILEANEVEIITHNREVFPATIVAYDTHSGLGLLRSLVPLEVPTLPLGHSAQLSEQDSAIVLNREGVTQVSIESRQTFTGSWEYLVDEAIFTTPAVGGFAGAALLNASGELVGVGSLFFREFDGKPSIGQPSNMFVPIDTLRAVMPDLLKNGRPSGLPRPWLGINVVSYFGHMLVQRVTPAGPADFAGVQAGDIILNVNGQAVDSLETLFKAVWDTGQAGTRVPLKILNGHLVREINIVSEDRYNHYQFTHAY